MVERECQVVYPGLCEYQEAFRLQKQVLGRRIAGKIPDTLIILQHPPVITIGRRGSRNNVLAGQGALGREGIAVYSTDRGGDVTYHGPGQIVAYPVLDLKQHGGDVHRAIGMYEEVIIRLLSCYGLEAGRDTHHPGVWVGGDKICALGIGISNWVTYHGFALNVNTNLEHFGFILPCGIAGRGVTSMARILGGVLDEARVVDQLVSIFGQVFNLEMKYNPVEVP